MMPTYQYKISEVVSVNEFAYTPKQKLTEKWSRTSLVINLLKPDGSLFFKIHWKAKLARPFNRFYEISTDDGVIGYAEHKITKNGERVVASVENGAELSLEPMKSGWIVEKANREIGRLKNRYQADISEELSKSEEILLLSALYALRGINAT